MLTTPRRLTRNPVLLMHEEGVLLCGIDNKGTLVSTRANRNLEGS